MILLRYVPPVRRPPTPTAEAAGSPGDSRREPWLLLCPAGAVPIESRDAAVRLAGLAPGTPVALVDDRLLSRRRLRRIARAHAIVVDRELLVLPTRSHAVMVVDDVPGAVHHFWHALAAVPPGLSWASAPGTLALRVVRRMPWTWTGAVAPSRVLVGRTP